MGEEGEYGEETVTTVTIVITDIDDELPVFTRDKVAVPVPEDIGKICIIPVYTFLLLNLVFYKGPDKRKF